MTDQPRQVGPGVAPEQAVWREDDVPLRAVFESAPIGLAVADTTGRLVQVNAAFSVTVGHPAAGLVGRDFLSITHPDDRAQNRDLRDRLLAGEIDSYRMDKRYVRADGGIVETQVDVSLVHDEQGPSRLVAQVQDLTDRRRAERQAREAEQRFRAAFESAPIGMGVVSLDRHWVQVNRALCEITGFDEDELLRRNVRAMTHTDDLAEDAEHIRELLAGEVDSYRWEKRYIHANDHEICVYIGEALIRDETGEPLYFVAQVEDITDRKRLAAEAIENARSYAREHAVAATLQRSLLPERLPEIAGIELAASYQPASADAAVGGDFYDVFEVGDDAWGLVIGDVVGKGAAAAALTSLARHTIRAAAIHERDPRSVLETLNRALAHEGRENIFCTVLYALLERDADGARLTLASGGHPLPLVIRADGAVGSIGAPGMLLGSFDDVALSVESTRLECGDALVLYTDGVPEARANGGLFGYERLIELLASSRAEDATAIARRIEAAALAVQDGDVRDDIALLVVRLPTGAEAPPQAAVEPDGDEPDATLSLRLTGGPSAPAAARAAIERLDLPLESDQRFSAELLVSELVTNAVVHAGAGDAETIELEAWVAQGLMHVSVSDAGPGFNPTLRPAREDEEAGRGLYLVEAMADRWGISREGACVWFELAVGDAAAAVA